MKQRFYLIVAAIILLVLLGIALASSRPQKTASLPASIAVCRVLSGIGIDRITITNFSVDNKISKINATSADFRFNFTKGDTLVFNATISEGYDWNSWLFSDGTFDHHNALTIRPSGSIVITALVEIRSVS